MKLSKVRYEYGASASRPAGARGLKPAEIVNFAYEHGSRPAGARGLKQVGILNNLKYARVAPRRGAWIETPYMLFDTV